MALALVAASPVPPPKKVVALHSASHFKKAIEQPAVTPTETPQPQSAEQPETPAPAPQEAPAPVVPSYPAGHNEIMAAAGIAASDYGYVDYIVSRESGWCATKWQGQTSCPDSYASIYAGDEADPWRGYGMCQSTPAIKMATAGDDWRSNPVTQMSWCNSYAISRHGGWYNAYAYWINHHNW